MPPLRGPFAAWPCRAELRHYILSLPVLSIHCPQDSKGFQNKIKIMQKLQHLSCLFAKHRIFDHLRQFVSGKGLHVLKKHLTNLKSYGILKMAAYLRMLLLHKEDRAGWILTSCLLREGSR
jgi:hypothetical protein